MLITTVERTTERHHQNGCTEIPFSRATLTDYHFIMFTNAIQSYWSCNQLTIKFYHSVHVAKNMILMLISFCIDKMVLHLEGAAMTRANENNTREKRPFSSFACTLHSNVHAIGRSALFVSCTIHAPNLRRPRRFDASIAFGSFAFAFVITMNSVECAM